MVFLFLFTDWSSLVVAKVSPWIQVDSTDPVVRRNSEKVSNAHQGKREEEKGMGGEGRGGEGGDVEFSGASI